jgi:hypothetical protein
MLMAIDISGGTIMIAPPTFARKEIINVAKGVAEQFNINKQDVIVTFNGDKKPLSSF